MANYKISVVIPVYDGEKYIGDTLDSVINQDFDDYEIIVIDDGSTDNTSRIVLEKLDNTDVPSKMIYEENMGVSIARNGGIAVADGDFLVFVDGDDYILPNHLSSLYDENYDFSMIQYVEKNGEKLSKPFKIDKDELSVHEFMEMEFKMEMPFKFFQLIYKRDLLLKNNVLFEPFIVYGEDTEFAHKILGCSDKIRVCNEVTYYYNQHEDSAVNTTNFKRFQVVCAFERVAEFLKKTDKKDLIDLIYTSRIPRAIFGNMNYFFYNSYDFDEIMSIMEEYDFFNKLSRFEGDFKFKLKIKLFLKNPRLYYKIWRKLKNSID